MFLIIYKIEFISLLNNSEIKIPLNFRLVNKGSEIKKDELIHRLLNLPQFDYDEDLLIIKYEEADDNENNIDIQIEKVFELIPLTNNAFLAYQRKFSRNIDFKDPTFYHIEGYYNDYLKRQISKEIKKSVSIIYELILNDNGEKHLDDSFLDYIISAKQAKIVDGKRDVNIRKDEYKDVFQTLFIYEDGSHIPRSNSIGFILHALASSFYHIGGGGKILVKSDLRNKIPSIKYILDDSLNNSYLSIIGSFEYIKSKSKTDEYLAHLIDVFEKHTILNKDVNPLLTATHFLYFRFLLEVEKISFSDLEYILKELKVEYDPEVEIALVLTAAYFPLSKITNDLFVKSSKIKIFLKDNNLSNSLLYSEKKESIAKFLTSIFQTKVLDAKVKYENEKKELEAKGYILVSKSKVKGYEEEKLNNPINDSVELWARKKSDKNVSNHIQIIKTEIIEDESCELCQGELKYEGFTCNNCNGTGKQIKNIT